MKKILVICFVIVNLVVSTHSSAKLNSLNNKSCYKNDIISNKFSKIMPVTLPFSSKSRLKKENTKLFSEFSDSFLQNIADNNGDFVHFGSLIKLPDICEMTVFLSVFTDEGELNNYSLNVFKNGKGHSINLGTGSEFWIDKKYNIKVKSFNGKSSNIEFYKISNDGRIVKK